MNLKVKNSLVYLLLIVLVSSCQEWKGQKKESPEDKKVAVQETAENDSLAYALGLQIQEAIYSNDIETFTRNFDVKEFQKKITYFPEENSYTKRYRQGFLKGFDSSLSFLPKKIYGEIAMGGSYDFLQSYYDPETLTYRLLFRLFSEETGINYHDYLLRQKNGAFLLEDIYVYLSGEYISESMQKLYVASMPKTVFEKILQQGDADNTRLLNSAMQAQQKGHFEEVLGYLDQLQGDLGKKKIIHVLRIQAAARVGDQEYKNAMREMLKDLTDDPTAYLLSVDYYILTGNFEEAQRSIDKLEMETGDSFLNYLRGNIAFEARDYEKAISAYKIIADEFPEYYNGRTSLMAAYSQKGSFDDCLSIMQNLVEEEVLTKEEMINFVEEGTDAVFEPLIVSPAYKNWRLSS